MSVLHYCAEDRPRLTLDDHVTGVLDLRLLNLPHRNFERGFIDDCAHLSGHAGRTRLSDLCGRKKGLLGCPEKT